VPHVIAPVLRPGAATTTIASVDCLRCGRCVERCGEQVFDWRLGAPGR
jgi:ferredoxin